MQEPKKSFWREPRKWILIAMGMAIGAGAKIYPTAKQDFEIKKLQEELRTKRIVVLSQHAHDVPDSAVPPEKLADIVVSSCSIQIASLTDLFSSRLEQRLKKTGLRKEEIYERVAAYRMSAQKDSEDIVRKSVIEFVQNIRSDIEKVTSKHEEPPPAQ